MRCPSPWFLLPILGTLALGGFWMTRPRWRTASQAEVEAWLDPAFKGRETSHPAARERFERLQTTVLKVGYGVTGNPQMRIFNEPNSGTAEALWKLSGEGPVQRPIGVASPTYGHLRLLAEALGAAGATLARQRDSTSATKRFATALWVINQIGPHPSEFFDIGAISGALRKLDADLESALPHLAEPDLALLASRMPPTPRENPILRQSLVFNLRRIIVPVLADPEAWAEASEPNTPPAETMDTILLGETSDDLHRGRETYDAELTVRNVNRIFVPMLDNAMVGPSEHSHRGENFANDLAAYLPISGAAGKQGWERKWKEFRYRWELGRTRNSYGDRLLHIYGKFFGAFQQHSYQSITLRESMRTRIALRRYRLKFGRSAPSLDALTQSGFLTKPPIDGSAAGNLRYDPARKRIWSMGRNLVDDGGKAKRFGDFFQLDYVWETP